MNQDAPATTSVQSNQPSNLNKDEPHSIRITTSGKLKAWVSFALDFFENNEDKSLILHTLPATKPAARDETGVTGDPPKVPKTATSTPQSQPGKGRLSNATTVVPRLISVTEIIKREYLKKLAAEKSTRMVGLHQYNELGCLEDLGLIPPTAEAEQNDGDRAQMLISVLEGKNHPKQKQTPYMRITLSPVELPHLVEDGATYQPPTKRKMSKSARHRARKREQKLGTTGPGATS